MPQSHFGGISQTSREEPALFMKIKSTQCMMGLVMMTKQRQNNHMAEENSEDLFISMH